MPISKFTKTQHNNSYTMYTTTSGVRSSWNLSPYNGFNLDPRALKCSAKRVKSSSAVFWKQRKSSFSKIQTTMFPAFTVTLLHHISFPMIILYAQNSMGLFHYQPPPYTNYYDICNVHYNDLLELQDILVVGSMVLMSMFLRSFFSSSATSSCCCSCGRR